MIALFTDDVTGQEIRFEIVEVTRLRGTYGPPLGCTYHFADGRKVPLELVDVESSRELAVYRRFLELHERLGKGETGMPRAKGSTGRAPRKKKVEAVNTLSSISSAMSQGMGNVMAPKSDSPKYISMEDGEMLWELDFPEKPELFRQLVEERIHLKSEMDRMKSRIDEINGSILPFFERNKMPGVRMEDWLVRRHEGQSATLDKEALVMNGVPADVIEKCTVRKRFVTIVVKGPREKE